MERRKWADFLISMVKYDEPKTHIVEVEVREDLAGAISFTTEIVSRETVLQNIENKITYMTVFADPKGKWNKGQKVEIITVNGQKFIKSLNDGIARDNLDRLPEF